MTSPALALSWRLRKAESHRRCAEVGLVAAALEGELALGLVAEGAVEIEDDFSLASFVGDALEF